MSYFTTRKTFLTPSFDISVKEEQKIIKFLTLLEKSGVGSIIEKHIQNNKGKGGRPNVNYYNLFATIIYGFAFERDTLRDLEDACEFDLRYIYLMEQKRISYTTICKFINTIIVPNEKEIFSLINIQIKNELQIDYDDAFIDGSKFEANANKYKFVWKPTTFHKRLSITFFELLKKYKLCESFRSEEMVSSKTVSSAISHLSDLKEKYTEKDYNKLIKSFISYFN